MSRLLLFRSARLGSDASPITDHKSPSFAKATACQANHHVFQRGVGRSRGAGRPLGVGIGLGLGVGVGVAVGGTVGVGVGLGVGVSAGPFCTSNEPMSMRLLRTR